MSRTEWMIEAQTDWGMAWNSDRWDAGAEYAEALAWNAHMCAMMIMALEA